MVYLVTPFIDGGEVFDWICEEGGVNDQAKMDTVRRLFRQLVEGMKVPLNRRTASAEAG